jgi:hypothetical protein
MRPGLGRKTSDVHFIGPIQWVSGDLSPWVQRPGGRGLMQMDGAYTVDVIKLMEYVESKEDPLIGHTNITQTQRCFEELIFRNPFKVKQSK